MPATSRLRRVRGQNMTGKLKLLLLTLMVAAFTVGGIPSASASESVERCRDYFSEFVCSTAEDPGSKVWPITDPIVARVVCTINGDCPLLIDLQP